ncbi:MAG: MBL fold metallo-hydrolase [Gammaproteobacteria bacterium]|nr:MAG: MBL fold metallo-hydrolase [Gammaproteobacteria bacterium]
MNPIETLDHGITRIDSGYVRPALAAFYLVAENGRVAFIDTGTSHSLPLAVAALEQLGLERDQVDYVMPTHVHLDHGGGAGALMAAFPAARLVVHPRGASHLIDPARLIAGSTVVYGEKEMARLFGEVVPIPAERVIESMDGMEVDLGGRPLRLLHTPGHALHHYCVWDVASRGIFSGDTFGISYRELDTARGPFLFATTTPVQLDPDAWLATVDRLMALDPDAVYLTHFGRVGDLDRLANDLRDDLVFDRDLARAHRGDAEPAVAIRAGLQERFLARLEAHGCTLPRAELLELLAMDLDLNSQGLAVWLARQQGR